MNGYTKPSKAVPVVAAFGACVLALMIVGEIHRVSHEIRRIGNPVTACRNAAYRVQARTARELDAAALSRGVPGDNYAAIRDAAEILLTDSLSYCGVNPEYRFDIDGAPPAM